MSVDEKLIQHHAPVAPGPDTPVAVRVDNLHKTFRIPLQRVDSFKERAVHPFAAREFRELHALDGISFEVRQGEFFGIVGRNGSGKSTLLKLLASIYRADAGKIQIAGRMAPFIELGVGFNLELTARENVILNGVMMGLTPKEVRRRIDAVIDFAELRDFADLKLKNYSSGMMVRLAFAIMVQADADVMLIDEVLAVGDAAFGQKCMDVFHERKRAGRTIVLVSHDMATVESMCHRAMLLHDGRLEFMGEPGDVALRYYRRNFAKPLAGEPGRTAVPDFNVAVRSAHLLDQLGAPVENVEEGAPLRIAVELEAQRDLDAAKFTFQLVNEDGVMIFSFLRELDGRAAAGELVRVAGRIENRLVPGRYSVSCWVRRDREGGDMAVQGVQLLEFFVYGTGRRAGVVSLETDVTAVAGGA
jgi:ABC-type polysaccharide/polyol phosphate transport system ATPase subunit